MPLWCTTKYENGRDRSFQRKGVIGVHPEHHSTDEGLRLRIFGLVSFSPFMVNLSHMWYTSDDRITHL